jgi:hypothetical protein
VPNLVSVVCVAGEQNGEEFVSVSVSARPGLDAGKAYIKLTEREKSLAVNVFQSFQESGTGVNEAIRRIKVMHPLLNHVGRASIARWSTELEAAPAAAANEASKSSTSRKGGRGLCQMNIDKKSKTGVMCPQYSLLGIFGVVSTATADRCERRDS